MSEDCVTRELPTGRPDVTACTLGYVKQKKACVGCPAGKFSLVNWVTCRPLLDCEHVQDEVTQFEFLYSLGHWWYYRASYKNYEIMYAKFNPGETDMISSSRIQPLSASLENALYPIGFCEEEGVVLFASNRTFMGPGGDHFEDVMNSRPSCNHCMVRLHLSMSYVRVLAELHGMDAVLCNSLTLSHLLSQFLITEKFSLVLSSLDNLPRDVNGPIICWQKELKGDFIAPEQKWPYGSTKIFNPSEQPKYDRKSDIWKVPNVVSALLGPACGEVRDYLIKIHKKCKSLDPQSRPTASQLLKEYERIYDLLLT